ncbi:MAG: hypothetical protein G01um101418_497 [Parcubacteria group bacterium Gr01-1014_18]|nr:MAG: hypothetical protein Greene041636_543 [Parcubacteria group bacterium Greene0416_36]TSC81084.1 MAG: hypothetical protein G01um101418_497 [Parcubacteria group bacterium Gr01-1014_18]TSC98818.1 MAG: hypothetical protein Greene101420_568 [Parcubacteria group bacterium Greene1014_20]TSD06702.1 MAG: hypothetical protein Greene07142_623 [Parcubacteria group bacterium Greene0714_2]
MELTIRNLENSCRFSWQLFFGSIEFLFILFPAVLVRTRYWVLFFKSEVFIYMGFEHLKNTQHIFCSLGFYFFNIFSEFFLDGAKDNDWVISVFSLADFYQYSLILQFQVSYYQSVIWLGCVLYYFNVRRDRYFVKCILMRLFNQANVIFTHGFPFQEMVF